MKRHLLIVIWALCCLPVAAQNLPVYTDALVNGFEDYSFGAPLPNQSSTVVVHTGTNSISWQPQNYSGLSFAHPTSTLSTATYSGLSFWIWCSADCTRPVFLSFQLIAAPGTLLKNADLVSAYPQGGLPTGQWTQMTISVDAGPWMLSPNTSFDRFNLQDNAGTVATNTIYIDDVQLIARAAGPPPPPSTAPLAYTASSTVNGIAGSQFAWIDSRGDPRSAHMATGTGGVNKGGVLNQFIYRLANGSTRTVNQSGCCGAGGFGYIVSHLETPSIATNHAGEDDSPLGPPQGDNPGGATQTVFAGRHHALHMYTLNYPRWGRIGAVDTKYNMPVTIGWIFATGRNHPLWTVSFDMTQMPANAVSADTRAPYGDMNFDGTAGEGADGDVAGGVGWGDRYKFRSTSAPFTLNSGWTWNTPNTIPHNMLWTQNIDSEMGIVLTQPIAQQDAGGYFGVNQWMKTSANGSLCANPISVMPCDFTWPFQSINYSFGGNANATTQSKRLAWGADFGYIGQTNYPDRATGANRSGYPYQSYSTYIVLDQHSRAPTDTQVTQMEARQLGSVAATVGMVAANGPAGLGRVDTIAYSPNGFDPVFDAWTFTAGASNNLTASFTIAAPAQLNNPLIIVRGYNLATEPFQVKVAGITRTADVDYYASAVPSRNELWLTLRGQYQNTTSLEITGASPLVSYTVTATAGTNGSISPAARTVASGATTTFTVNANAGYAAAVNGCGGALNAGVYTTAAVVADCAVTASFTVLPTTLAAVQSRKTHGAAGTFDLRLDQAFTVEPRTIGAGHLIVFQFSQPVTITGTVTATNGMVTATSVNSEVRVTLTGIADNARTTISLSGVNGNVAAAVSLGFLVGDVNNSQAVKASDVSGVKARVAQAQPLTTANFQYDLNTDGSLTSADISAVKGRAGQVLQ